MKLTLTILVLCINMACAPLIAQQTYHRCYTTEHLHDQLLADPGLAARMQQIERTTRQYVQSNPSLFSRSVITVPVVVHVVYNTAAQNISDTLILAQINQLNLDYARLNSDAANTPAAFATVAANTNVQFCLAQSDSNGSATTGIIRKQTTVTAFSTNDNVKYSSTGGDDAWPAASYLNIWICNMGGGVLGYAQFPGGPAATDGIVVLYSSVGSVANPSTATPYNLGRTATHEVGHWLNLYHVWGDDGGACTGTDNVSDTPNQGAENFGCPAFPHTDNCTASPPGVMFMNYMDYTDDGCMNMFTQGQAARMNALFAAGGVRESILSSLGCVVSSNTCSLASGLSVTNVTTSAATLNWTAVPGASSYNIQYRNLGTTTWTNTNTVTNSYNITGLAAGTNYEWQVQTVCSSGSSVFTGSSAFSTTNVPCNAPAGLITDSITTNSAILNWIADTGAVSFNIQYRIAGVNAWISAASTVTSYHLPGLAAASVYQWQVQTVCSVGTSSFTSPVTFTTANTFCGVPSGLNVGNITNASAVLSWGAISGASNYNLQWKAGGASSWNMASDLTGNSYNLTGLNSCNPYRFKLQSVCSIGSSVYSAADTFSTVCSSTYCTSGATSSEYGYIERVALGTINNISNSDSGYADFTYLSTDIMAGATIPIYLTPDYRHYNPVEYWAVYIDYNQNGIFTDAGEKVLVASGGDGISASFTVPKTALNGSTRMRVQMQYDTLPTSPCAAYTYGEVEDYTVNIIAGPRRITQQEADLENSTVSITNVKLYPDPAQDYITLEFNSSSEAGIKMNLYNISGQRMMAWEMTTVEGFNTLDIAANSLSSGVYVFEIENQGNTSRRKFIISK